MSHCWPQPQALTLAGTGMAEREHLPVPHEGQAAPWSTENEPKTEESKYQVARKIEILENLEPAPCLGLPALQGQLRALT